MNVTVIGLGKIGLPLAVAIASADHSVHGVDTSPSRLHDVLAGTADPGESDLSSRLRGVLRNERLVVSSGLDCVADADVVAVIIPVGLEGEQLAALGPLLRLTEDISRRLRRGALVVFETTLPVGTTRSRLTPALEHGSGLSLGVDLHVAYSPERVFSGRVFRDLGRYPKLVGGVDPASGQRAKAFYESFLRFDARSDLPRPNGVWLMSSSDAAEFAKLAETTYRDVNIALANEFARFADSAQIDVQEVIAAANSQPFSHLHTPGASVGGHCIPVYPHFYLQGDPNAALPANARRVNVDMPRYMVDQLVALSGPLRGKRVAILGVTYRRSVKETSNSGALALAEKLQAEGADVVCHDPLLSAADLATLGLRVLETPATVDAVILHTDHDLYTEWSDDDFPGVRVVLDGRGGLTPWKWSRATFKALGRPLIEPKVDED